MIRTLSNIIVFLFASTAAYAETYAEKELDRLFTSKDTRVTIDKRRDNKVSQSDSPRRVASTVTVNGIVKRSDGKSTVWVNGRPDLNRRTIDGVTVARKQGRSDSVSLYVDGELVKIQPGETWSKKQPDD